MPETYTPEDVEKTRADFPKSDKDSLSYASTIPGPAGGTRITGEFSGEDYRLRPFAPESQKKGMVENERDESILNKTFEKIGKTTPPERKQVLVDLVASFENGDNSFRGEMITYLRGRRSQLELSADPRVQAQNELVGMLGEKVNLMFDLDDPRIVTLAGEKVVKSLPPVSIVATADLLESKAFLAKVNLSMEEAFGEGGGFKNRERDLGYPNFKEMIYFDPQERAYEANPEIMNADLPPVQRVLRQINEAMTKPDALLQRRGPVDRVKPLAESNRMDLPDRQVFGVVEIKNYYPWEVDALPGLTEENPNRSELGGKTADGMNLTIPLKREANYAKELSPWPFTVEDRAAVVRFPADAPRASVRRLSELAISRGLNNVVFQLLPVTRAELDTLIEETLKSINLEKIISKEK